MSDFCPKCGSQNVMTQYDDFSDRSFLHCNGCNYLEARNIDRQVDQELEQEESWEQSADWWKYG